MVLKKSVFKMQKQRNKNFKDPSYGYEAIHEMFQNCSQASCDCTTYMPGPVSIH